MPPEVIVQSVIVLIGVIPLSGVSFQGCSRDAALRDTDARKSNEIVAENIVFLSNDSKG